MFFLFSKFLVKFFINKNHHNTRASDDTDMELSPLFKLEKIKYSDVKKNWKRSHAGNCQVMSLSFFQFMVELGQYGSRTADACSVNLVINNDPVFNKKLQTEQKSLTQLSYYWFEERCYFWLEMLTSSKSRDPVIVKCFIWNHKWVCTCLVTFKFPA